MQACGFVTLEWKVEPAAAHAAFADEVPIARLKRSTHTYAHGGFMALAFSMMSEPQWRKVLKVTTARCLLSLAALLLSPATLRPCKICERCITKCALNEICGIWVSSMFFLLCVLRTPAVCAVFRLLSSGRCCPTDPYHPCSHVCCRFRVLSGLLSPVCSHSRAVLSYGQCSPCCLLSAVIPGFIESLAFYIFRWFEMCKIFCRRSFFQHIKRKVLFDRELTKFSKCYRSLSPSALSCLLSMLGSKVAGRPIPSAVSSPPSFLGLFATSTRF
jgi:hypothetical protein